MCECDEPPLKNLTPYGRIAVLEIEPIAPESAVSSPEHILAECCAPLSQ